MLKKYVIFHLEGGLGKHVAAIAVAKCIKNNYPDRDLIIVCGYPEVFINLNFVDRVYRIGAVPYFYEDYIKNKDSIILKHEPYFTTEHIHKKMSLIENWCKLYNLEYKAEQPELVFNIRQKQFGVNMWSRNKPIMLIHSNGGPLEAQPYPYSWTRDMPVSVLTELVKKYSPTHHIIQVCRNNSYTINGIEAVTTPMSNMELFTLLLHSDKRVLIDSCLQHAAAALNKKSTVLWIGTSAKIFGYDMHSNVAATLDSGFKLPDSYLFDYNFHGALHECPIMDDDIFNINDIFDSIDNTK